MNSIYLKGLVHFQMKISPSFTHPQDILGVYDFLLSDEHNQRNINKYPDASELYNGSEWDQWVWAEVSPSTSIHHKRVLHITKKV